MKQKFRDYFYNIFFLLSYRKGLVLYRQKKWGEALLYFKKAYQKDPKYASNTFKLGLCHLKLKELYEAQYYIRKAIEQAPHNKQWKVQLKQCQNQIENSVNLHFACLGDNIVRINQGGVAKSLNINLRQKLLLVPSDYNHRVMADVSSFIEYYKDKFEIYIIVRELLSDIVYKSTHILVKNNTPYSSFLKFTADYVIDAGTMNYSYRITDTNTWISVWHGIPYKKMFVDLDKKHISGAVRYGMAYDAMISMSDFYTNTFLRKAMYYDGAILKIGCAKMDGLLKCDTNQRYIDHIRQKIGISSDKKVVLYAPDFKEAGELILPFDAQKLLNHLSNIYCLLVLLPSQYCCAPQWKQHDIYYTHDLEDFDALVIADILLSDYNPLIYVFDQYNKPVVLLHEDFDTFLFNNPSRHLALKTLSKRYFVAKTSKHLIDLDWGELQTLAKKFHMPTDLRLSFIKNQLGIALDKKIILYAPTYRQRGSIPLPFNPDKLSQYLNNEYIIITKLHYLNCLSCSYNSVIDCTSYSNIADLMKISDILISDYSSLVLDFSLLNKPIILFQYDYDDYMSQRGVYFDFFDYLPSENIVKNEMDLYRLNWKNLKSDHQKIINDFYPLENGDSTQKIVKTLDFQPKNRHSKDIIFLVNELNQIGGVHSFLKNMAKYYKEQYNTRIFVIAIKEFAESNSEFHVFESPYIDFKISSQYLNGACATILQNTDGLVVSLQFSAHLHFQKYLSGAKSVLMFHGDVKDMLSRELYSWHLDAINENKIYNYKKLLLLTESSVDLLKPCLTEEVQSKLGFIHNSIEIDYTPIALSNKWTAAVISRLDPDKNIFSLIDLGKEILAQDKDIVINIYGDGALKEEFRVAIITNGLGSILKLHGFESDKEKIFRQNDVLFLMSKSEGFPLVVLEAYAYGRPVIAFDSFTAAKDIIQHGKTGFLLPYGDYFGVVKAVFESQNIIQDNIKLMFDKFSNQVVFAAWNKLICELDNVSK